LSFFLDLHFFPVWLVDRFHVNWVMAAGFCLWSSAAAVTGSVHGFAKLGALHSRSPSRLPIPHTRRFWCETFRKNTEVLQTLSSPAIGVGHLPRPVLRELVVVLSWLPFYLLRERYFAVETMAKIGGITYLLSAISAMVCGWPSDHWIAAGESPTRVRKVPALDMRGHVCRPPCDCSSLAILPAS